LSTKQDELPNQGTILCTEENAEFDNFLKRGRRKKIKSLILWLQSLLPKKAEVEVNGPSPFTIACWCRSQQKIRAYFPLPMNQRSIRKGALSQLVIYAKSTELEKSPKKLSI